MVNDVGMRITQKVLHPSNEDAVRLKRSEKMGMIVLSYAATVLDDLRNEIPGRINMAENGMERLTKISEETDALLNDLRLTVPMDQRMHLQNTAKDMEMRITPKATPSESNVLMQKEEFRSLVDFARTKCRECTDDDEECTKCELYKLLTVILPMEDYHYRYMCPYNLGEWGN